MNTPVKESPVAIVNRAVVRQARAREPRTISRRMALLDTQGNVVAVDNDWTVLAKETGAELHRLIPGINYLEICRQTSKTSAASRKALLGIQAVMKGDLPSFAMDYACPTPTGSAFFRMSVTPLVYLNARVAIAHTDVTDLQQSKENDFKHLQQFARQLIDSQEQERQKLAREIHDDLGNQIALIAFSVRQAMKQERKSPKLREEELNKVLDDIGDLSASLREISHHLYPPTLRYAGIRAALRSLVEQFEEGNRIKVDLAIPSDLPRLPDEVQLCIFRISQECLRNIAQHSGAHKARIAFECTSARIRLTVSDTGRGFVKSEVAQKGGLGLLSMEERALNAGGYFAIHSSPGLGSEVCLTIPMQKEWAISPIE